MAIYTAKDFAKLVNSIKGKDSIVLKASKNTIDRSGTFAVNESVKMITRDVNLPSTYIKQGIRYVSRPTLTNLSAIVEAEVRGTLLSRYPNSVNSGKNGGGTVSINKGSTTSIDGLRYVTLRGSGERVIGLFNKDAVIAFRNNLSKGKGATIPKLRKFRNLVRRAKNKPYGRTPLHSKSIDQMFSSVRHSIQPALGRFMRNNFLKEFNRLNK